MITERLEDMSPRGFLRLIRQDDGDIIVAVGQCGADGIIDPVAAVEFCTVGSGGGGSHRVREALINLMGAIAEDNLDVTNSHRRGEDCDPVEDYKIAAWVREYNQAKTEIYGR